MLLPDRADLGVLFRGMGPGQMLVRRKFASMPCPYTVKPGHPTLRVQTLFLHPYLGWRGSDYLYYKKLKELERVFPITLPLCSAPLPVVLGNTLFAANALLARSGRRLGMSLPGWWHMLNRLIIVPSAGIGSHADVLYTNFLIPANRTSIPIVLEWDFLAYGAPEEQKVVADWLRVPAWFIRRTKVVAVRHELSRAAFAATYPRYAEKAVIVPFYLPWVEPVSEDEVIRKFQGLSKGVVSVLFVGNDAHRKGLPNLLAACRRLRHAQPRIRLTVVSEFRDGPVALPADAVVHSYLKPRDVYALMAEAHIFAMPTRREAAGLVYWEAMANGCALLVPDRSPQRELFGEYGLSASPDDVEAMTEVLKRLLEDRTLTLTLALRGRQSFVTRYHHSVVGRQYWNLFQRAASSI